MPGNRKSGLWGSVLLGTVRADGELEIEASELISLLIACMNASFAACPSEIRHRTYEYFSTHTFWNGAACRLRSFILRRLRHPTVSAFLNVNVRWRDQANALTDLVTAPQKTLKLCSFVTTT